MDDSDNPLFVTALAKGLTVLAAFVPGHGEMTLGELTEATGLNKSTVQRSAFTLEALGYLVKDPNSRRFRLTPKSLELGGGYLRLGELIERANPYLHELNRNTGESCNLLEPCGSDMVYVARFASHKEISIHVPLGQRLPMYCTAAGRAFLSALPPAEARDLLERSDRVAMTQNTITELPELLEVVRRAHAEGYATSNEEYYVGDLAVGAPIVNAEGRPLGAINVAVPFSRWTLAEAVTRLAPMVINTARSVSNAARSIRSFR